MLFGQKIRELRLKSKMGLRRFSDKIKVRASFLSDLEHGYIPFSKESKWIFFMIENLEIEDTMDEMELLKLWQEPFVMQKMSENFIPSVFTHTTDGKRLTEEKFRELCEWFDNKTLEHNKKADEYNKGINLS